jgi:hypothetical protein
MIEDSSYYVHNKKDGDAPEDKNPVPVQTTNLNKIISDVS